MARESQARLYQTTADPARSTRAGMPSWRAKAYGVLMAFVVSIALWGGIIWIGGQVAAAING